MSAAVGNKLGGMMDRSMDEPASIDLSRIAAELGHSLSQIQNVVALLDAGNTIPFITRYRKEKTGNLDEEQLRAIEQRVRSLRQLQERTAAILRLIEAQGKLTPELRAEIEAADTLKRLEDLYLPYRSKRTSRASAARQRGLEPLAARIWAGDPELTDLTAAAAAFVNLEQELPSSAEVLQGAADILAENISEEAALRDVCRQLAWRTGKFLGTPTKAGSEKGHEYRDYFEFTEAVAKIPPHRVLALNRGEKSGALRVKFDWDDAAVQAACDEHYRWDTNPKRERGGALQPTAKADNLARSGAPALADASGYIETGGVSRPVPNAGDGESTGAPNEQAAPNIQAAPNGPHPHREFLKACLTDALQRMIQPSLEREVRRELSDKAEQQAIDVFARNLRSLLLQPPMRGQRVLVAAISELICPFAWDVVLALQVFRRQSHVDIDLGLVVHHPRIGRHALHAHRKHAHAFRSTCHKAIAHTSSNLRHSNSNSFQTRSTIPIDDKSWHFLSKRAKGNLTTHLQALFAFGIGAADNDIVHLFRIYFWHLCHEVFDDINS